MHHVVEPEHVKPEHVKPAQAGSRVGRRQPSSTRCRFVMVVAMAGLQACSSILHAPDGARYQSGDGSRTALVQNGRVVLNGQPDAPRFDGIMSNGVHFSHDGRRVAYLAMRGSDRFLVADGREYGPFDGTSTAGVQFSPSGKRLTLALVHKDRWHMWLDGDLSVPYDGVSNRGPAYSRDDSRIAYAARRGDAWSLVLDGVEQPPAQGFLDDFGFTSGDEFYAAYKLGETWRVRIAERVSESFDAINKPGLIPSTSRKTVGFIARRGDQVFVCVNLVCGPPHRVVGTRVLVDTTIFGENFWKSLGLGVALTVVGGLAGARVPVMSVSGGGSARYTTVGSIVFSPDDRHHAYVAGDPLDAVVINGGAARIDIPPDQSVEWMSFDDTSQVLMYRLSGDTTQVLVAPVPGLPRHDGTGAGGMGTLALKLPDATALVFVDGRFAGVSPSVLQVSAGTHVVRMQAPGRVAKEVQVTAAVGQELTVDLDSPPDPVRAAVQAAIARFDDPKLPLAAKTKRDHVWRGRVMAAVPHSDEVIGVALYGAGADALVFGSRAIYVHNESSSRSVWPLSQVVDYTEFARRSLPTDHRAFEVTLTPGVVLKTAGMSLGKQRLIEFLESLRSELATALGLVSPAGATR